VLTVLMGGFFLVLTLMAVIRGLRAGEAPPESPAHAS
jgi:hypothetical protein